MDEVVHLGEDAESWLAYLRSRGYPAELLIETVYRPRDDAGAGGRGATRLAAPPLYRAEDSNTAYLTDCVLDWLRHNEGRDWFVHVVYFRPHPPWIAPEPYNAMCDPGAVPAPVRAPSPAAEAAQHPLLRWELDNTLAADFLPLGTGRMAGLDETEVRAIRAVYYGLVSEVDHHVGRLLDYLRDSGQDDDTLVVFTSDHGEQLGDHHLFGKRGYFDEAFHVPLIIRDPRREAEATRGRHVAAFTEVIDVTPTILDWLGREVPVQCDGAPLTPFVRGVDPGRWRDAVHWAFDFRDVRTLAVERDLDLEPDQCSLMVIRDARYKYVHFAALPPLFFDLADDPHELRNLAGQPARAPEELAYAQRLLSWRMHYEDRVLANVQVGAGGLVEWKGLRR